MKKMNKEELLGWHERFWIDFQDKHNRKAQIAHAFIELLIEKKMDMIESLDREVNK